MSVRRVCDRSGKDIEGERAMGGPDFHVKVPWAPGLDGLTFEDLSDEQRRQVLDYLCSIAKSSGKKEKAEVQRAALAYGGGPLYPELHGQAAEPTILAEPVVVMLGSFEIPARGLEGKASDYGVGEVAEGTYLDGTPCRYQRHAAGWIELGPPENGRASA